MFSTIQLVTVLLVALAMVPAVAHALELPGKLRLAREQYLMVQRIYFPGFTFVGGIAETLSVFATLGLVLMLPRGTQQFHLALGPSSRFFLSASPKFFDALAAWSSFFWRNCPKRMSYNPPSY